MRILHLAKNVVFFILNLFKHFYKTTILERLESGIGDFA